MEFDSNRAIYLQIADNFCEKILSGELKPGDRIPSVREWGAEIGVNPNTVSRSYDELTGSGIIFLKRGIGCFVSGDARNIILEKQRKFFIENELPKFEKKAELLGINLKEIIK